MNRTAMAALLLIFVFVLHLIEEVRMGFRKKMLCGEMPLPVFVGINIFTYSFCLITFLLLIYESQLGVGFAWIFAVSMFINGTIHLGIIAVRRAYFPGGITAIPLLPISIYLLFLLV